MEIKKVYGELNPYSAQKLQETPRVQQDQAAQGAASARQLGDKVALSPEARNLATAVSVANTAPDTRADKVRDLKDQVQAGTYKPDIRKAAANLIREEVNLTR
ncbi:MAG: flagellar biosynthesis anti-sigma factor FlgM [Humidesulfovibrio sp.]|jgi:negative regulator of flagellin synthesis FlgM|uniref:flagellar biosynthesis anti-sigma factor FlgM n=1 Tax=Humidesulfovibrio sp. TaxID=2910988 RepID=UPI002733942A|nr:flagellar biosynthesis anti-sigma factor FlgM [Humidesulfovibrio sp.]MDP2847353.1 flagellar biosynthesis anti-sigma factor FlgM [Humidesulfovibrio sp.]